MNRSRFFVAAALLLGLAGIAMLAQQTPTLRDVLTGTPAGLSWSTNFNRVWSGTTGGTSVAPGTTVFLFPNNSLTTLPTTDTSAVTRAPVTRLTTLQNLFVICNPAPGAGRTNVVSIMTNGVASPLSVSVVGTNTTGFNTNSFVLILAGSEIGVRIASGTGAGVGSKISWSFEGK